VSLTQNGVVGVTHSPDAAGVVAFSGSGAGRYPPTGVWAKGVRAGYFEGYVEVTGNVQANDCVVTGGDCAEEFDVSHQSAAEPGTVMVFDEDGSVRPATTAYDKRVAGIVSGAGDYRPGLTLGSRPSTRPRVPIALVGKAFCKVDATYAPIEIGDLLTTSPTPGHAMKATDPARAFGTVIGKALSGLPDGHGLIPLLVTLQ
jgi:hypothetical protein